MCPSTAALGCSVGCRSRSRIVEEGYLKCPAISFIFLLLYDRNSNLNTHIFEDPENWTYTLIEEWEFLERGITTGPNTQVARLYLYDYIEWDSNIGLIN